MTDAYYARRWQTDAHRVLGELIGEGHDNGLPPLMWTLATTGALAGDAPGLGTDEDPRDAIARWAAHLGTTVIETTREDGRISLYAPFDRDGKRQGALRAEIYPDFHDDLTSSDTADTPTDTPA
ncbi:hypothetical protein [Streptomyces anulatus]|uniref:hypothetical protein n=1 Tax=Streptomyces anulatus TaxID=1892 RepID=UPI0037DC1665|nr:hypothetical protein OG536_39075 [Streptomyces anulatus]WSW88308.1 hypothetical protein OG536_38985 [Streptomyces anulatus]